MPALVVPWCRVAVEWGHTHTPNVPVGRTRPDCSARAPGRLMKSHIIQFSFATAQPVKNADGHRPLIADPTGKKALLGVVSELHHHRKTMRHRRGLRGP
eukprot:148587-Prymnesium_polylepis.1